MERPELTNCRHGQCFVRSGELSGLALVSIGNTLRADDGLGAVLTAQLSGDLKNALCLFDLGLFTGYLADALCGHRAAVIVDAVHSVNSTPGLVHIVDLANLFKSTAGTGAPTGPAQERPGSLLLSVATGSSHGISWLDELGFAGAGKGLPERLYFFGVEIADDGHSNHLSEELSGQLPFIQEQLNDLLRRLVESSNT